MQTLKNSTKKILMGIISSVAVLFPTVVVLAEPYLDQIRGQLLLIGVKYIEAGWEIHSPAYFNHIYSHTVDSKTYYLTAGERFDIVGVCDQDCNDIDLYLYDNNGNLITQDSGTDDVPLVGVDIYRTGSFTVKTKMYNCRTSSCYYGLAVFRR